MTPYEIIAQGIGILAMAIAVLSFQQKSQRGIVLMQFCSSILFTVHFGLMGATMGCILNGIGILRAAIFSRRDKHAWAAHIAWVPVFVALFIGTYVLSFTVFGTEPTVLNFLIELLPVLGMVATTVSFRAKNAALVRALSFISSPVWLTYNIINGSIGGSLTEAFTMLSIIIGIFRLDRKEKPSDAVTDKAGE